METSNNIDIYLKYLSMFMPHLSDGKTLTFDMLCFSRNRIVPYYVKPYKNNKSYSTQLKKKTLLFYLSDSVNHYVLITCDNILI